MQASIRNWEDRCGELKAASTVHESRAHALEGEGLSSAQVLDRLQVPAHTPVRLSTLADEQSWGLCCRVRSPFWGKAWASLGYTGLGRSWNSSA